MKKLILAALLIVCLKATAQQNTLLTPAFWQTKPDVAAVQAEIAKGNSPSQLNTNSFDPVVQAILGDAPTASIKYLVEQPGNDVAKLTHDGRTYLHWAAYKANVELTEYLISKGAKISPLDSHGATPLTFVAGTGQPDTKVYDVLIAAGANPKTELTGDGANVLLLSIPNDKDLTLTNYFVSKGLDLKSVDANGNNAFSYAARGGNIDQMKALLQKGVPVNANAMLMAAQGIPRRGGASSNGLPVYQYLESLGIKATTVAKSGENVLHYLVRKPGQAELITYFIGKGVDVNKADNEGNTVLMNAAASNRDSAVYAIILPKIKNINQANAKGVTALAMAIRNNTAGITGLLISKGADIKAVDKKGDNLAAYLIQSYRPAGNGPTAAQDEFGAKLKLLQNKGLDLAKPQADGNTLYHLAVAKNDVALMQRLQNLGIDINAKNKEGLTVLHKAAMISKNDAMLKYLVSAGAKKDIATNFNETAFDLATENESFTKNNVSVTFLK